MPKTMDLLVLADFKTTTNDRRICYGIRGSSFKKGSAELELFMQNPN